MSPQNKVNVLMVDDQPSKLLSYEVILEELGENLIKANSGREALECLLKTDVAVVLMDVSMPELDGFELAEIIRQHPRFQKTAIIFISAVHLTEMDQLQGYERGAVDYVSVPVIPELLRAKVSVFAELHRKAQQLETLNRELRMLSHRLIAAQDQERRRIARELHDSLGQDLSAAKMLADAIVMQNGSPDPMKRSAGELSSLVDHAIQQVRSISYLLHPPLLDEIGLHSALQWYLDGLQKRSGIEMSIKAEPADFPRLPADIETAIFRIVQEALTNVFRHSGASKASVLLTKGESEVACLVRDDGKGITEDVREFKPEIIGVGIAGMRQRVKEFDGELQLRNANPGTLIEITIPFPNEPPAFDPKPKQSRSTLPARPLIEIR
ncbi:MAG TPA: response regulator [Candidatus Acidoferrales bacterium]|jgi:signal transduction histidine kinase|nr:response regulator [Candidatus Acidoferrales bacterium]